MDWFTIRIREFIAWGIGLIGLVTGFMSGWDLIDKLFTGHPLTSLFALIYFLVLISALFGYFVFRQFQTIRKEKYANVAPMLHQAVHGIRDLQTFIRETRPKPGAGQNEYSHFFIGVRMKLSEIIDQLASVFRIVTSTHCRTSIKLLYPVEDQLYFYTYVRDRGSSEKCRTRDNQRAQANHDPLSKNARFAQLVSPDDNRWHYFSNDLSSDPEFETTSMTAYSPTYGHKLNGGKREKWPLPYKSTIACVIRQGSFEQLPARESQVLGLLTVDSESRHVFEERWDVQLVFVVADALFWPLQELLEVQQQAAKEGYKVR